MSVKSELVELLDNPRGYVGTVDDLLGDAYVMVAELGQPHADVKQWEAADMLSTLASLLDEVAAIVRSAK